MWLREMLIGRRCLAFTLVVLGVLMAPSNTSRLNAQEPADGSALDPAFANLQECVAGRGHLLAVFLIDESGSLSGPNGTDPEDRRVGGLATAVDSLRVVANGPEGVQSPNVEVLLAGFSGSFTDRSGGWRSLAGPADAELAADTDAFRDFDQGANTDYEAALAGARTPLPLARPNSRPMVLHRHASSWCSSPTERSILPTIPPRPWRRAESACAVQEGSSTSCVVTA